FTAVAREPRWQILKTAGIDLAKLRIEVRRRIAERHGRKTALPITALGRGFGFRPKRAMTNRLYACGDRILVVVDFRGAHQLRFSAEQFIETMKHEHAAAQPMRAHLETCAIVRERIGPRRPRGYRCRILANDGTLIATHSTRLVSIVVLDSVLPVVEPHFEVPR